MLPRLIILSSFTATSYSTQFVILIASSHVMNHGSKLRRDRAEQAEQQPYGSLGSVWRGLLLNGCPPRDESSARASGVPCPNSLGVESSCGNLRLTTRVVGLCVQSRAGRHGGPSRALQRVNGPRRVGNPHGAQSRFRAWIDTPAGACPPRPGPPRALASHTGPHHLE